MACFRFATGVANSWSIDSRAMRVLLPVVMFAWCVLAPAYPAVSSSQSLEDELRHLIAANADTSSDPAVLVKLANLYLNLGDDDLHRCRETANRI